MWKRCALVAAGCLSVAPAIIQSGYAQTPEIADIKRSKICSVASTKTVGTSIGTSKITMNNDGGWCWLSLWATHGSTLYVATFRVSQPPAHGQLLMGAVNGRARVAYQPTSGFAGEDSYHLVDTMNGLERAVTVTVRR